MNLDLKEQENIIITPYQWKKWGKYFVYTIIILGIIFLSRTLYKEYHSYKNEKAANLLEAFLSYKLSNQDINALKTLKKLQTKYPKSIATSRATLIIAGNSFELGKYNESKRHYDWVIKHQNDADIRAIAILRFATVLIQEKKYNEALNFLNKNKIDNFYNYEKLDLQGDIYKELGNKNKAIENYEKALSNVDDLSIKEYFKIKLNM